MRCGQVDPGYQLGQFLLRRGDLAGFVARHAIGFGQIAAQVPDPLAVCRRMAGHGDSRFGAAAQAVGVERLERRRLDDDHVQRAALHGRLLQAERSEQLGRSAAGAENDALSADLAAVNAQTNQLVAIEQRFDLLAGEQAVAGQLGQAGDQTGHIEHQFAEAVDLAFEFRVLQSGWQFVALDLTNPRAHCLAGEEAGEVAGQRAGRPEVMRIGQQAHAAEIQLALAFKSLAPAPWHVGDGFGCAG